VRAESVPTAPPGRVRFARMAREAEVAVFVARRGRGEILVVRRCAELGGYWHTVAGGIEPGEEAESAAARELAEETGLVAQLGRSRFGFAYPLDQEPPERRARYAPGLTQVPVECFLVDAPDDWEPTLDWEHDAYRWVRADDAPAALFWPDVGEALQRVLAEP
jgi:8-oxo-dGTP pyrophosphatase MutT (NUDIX family)